MYAHVRPTVYRQNTSLGTSKIPIVPGRQRVSTIDQITGVTASTHHSLLGKLHDKHRRAWDLCLHLVVQGGKLLRVPSLPDPLPPSPLRCLDHHRITNFLRHLHRGTKPRPVYTQTLHTRKRSPAPHLYSLLDIKDAALLIDMVCNVNHLPLARILRGVLHLQPWGRGAGRGRGRFAMRYLLWAAVWVYNNSWPLVIF